MNKTLAWMLAAAVSLALISPANAQDSKQRTGKVVRIKGDARYSTGNKVWQPLKVGMVLKTGYIVQTAMSSFVDVVVNEEESAELIELGPTPTVTTSSGAGGGGGGGGSVAPTPDHDVIRILDDSYLVFDSLKAVAAGADTVTETMLDLKKGSIFGNVKKQAAASRFEIKTPNGVAGIRGTLFIVFANGNIACVAGSIIVAYTDAGGNVVTEVVNAGQQFDAASKQVVAIPSALLSSLNDMAQQCNYTGGGRGPGGPRGKGKGKGGNDHGHDHVSKFKPNATTTVIINN